jgi:hypothetical protein
MSDGEAVESCVNKRRAESEDEVEAPRKRGRISPAVEEESPENQINHSQDTIEEAIKALDRIQYELNMGNVLLDSPESSDHDTPPESDDESSPSDDMLNQAHALGFAACIRETFRFLETCGVDTDNEIYKQLKGRFIGISN